MELRPCSNKSGFFFVLFVPVSIFHIPFCASYGIQKHILKHFRNAPLTKMNVLCEYSLFLIGDTIIYKFIQLAFIRYKNQNAVAHGCRDFVIILRQPQF